ncbi:MAG: tRNA lysidine(34) synthetase TilS [Candidatus Omnitrophota bacterium]
MILKKVTDTIQKYGLIHKGEKIVVGVSGGPDSVTLLYLLNSLTGELGITLRIAHLDHMLRKDSSKDKEFVERLSEKLKIPMTAARINIKEIAKKGSLEEIGRNARLGFLFKTARDTGARKIALGHNLDDQAETVLMRILRGTGLYGLSAMLPKKDIAGYQIVRPLIEISREEIEAFLRKKRIKPRIDLSNLEDIYCRNRIRNNLMPLLEKGYNKNIKQVLAAMAQSLAYDYDYLQGMAQKRMKGMKTRLSLKKLSSLHPAIRRLILRQAITGIKGNTRRITFQHIKEIEDLIANRPVNSIVDLPRDISVIKQKAHLFFYQR